MYVYAVGLIVLVLTGLSEDGPLEHIGHLDYGPIRETSGIVKSRRHPGIYWVHNDSGNPPALFAVRRDGSLVREYAVTIPNIDWEDIAIDDQGHLYLGDIGNNDNRLPVRAIYQLDEPDPSKPAEGPLRATTASYYRFPRGGRFDAEGLFLEGGRAVVVAKTFDGRAAALYAIPLDPPAPLLRPATPERIGALPEFREPVTGASLTPDGTRLAVCSYEVARVYERAQNEKARWKPIGSVRFQANEVEAICWDGRDLILAGEDRKLHRIPAAAWKPGPHRR